MILLLPVSRLITYIAAAYALAPALALYFMWQSDNSLTIYSAIKTAFAGQASLSLLLYIWFFHAWRWIWHLFPSLNTIVFPDLNGRWNMQIEWNRSGHSGMKAATAVIKQSFLHLSMEVHSDDSDSETYLAQPKKDPESGRPMLYYVYRVTPKQKAGKVYPAYNGSARLSFSSDGARGLQGNYFTDAGSQGHFLLTQDEL